MTADMLGLSFFTKRGDTAVITLTVPAYVTDSSRLNLTVVLSNTVEFTEVITSFTNGVSSARRSKTQSAMSDHFYCKLNSNSIVSFLFWLTNPFDNLKCSEGVCYLLFNYTNSIIYYSTTSLN